MLMLGTKPKKSGLIPGNPLYGFYNQAITVYEDASSGKRLGLISQFFKVPYSERS